MNTLININDIGGTVTKEDDRYVVKDNTLLNNLVVSSTDLKPLKSTSGHNHRGQEEVYFFVHQVSLQKKRGTANCPSKN